MHKGASHHQHRNSQKRIYLENAVYFLTCVTHHRERYFRERIFCEVFVENIKVCQQLKGFEVYGWFLGYDHFHMLVKPNGKWNYSKIMQSLKRNTSHNINFILGGNEGANNYSRLRYHDMLNQFRDEFLQKQPNVQKIPFPRFQWHQSFHDHIIRNEQDFLNHLNYIRGNPLKHNMPHDWPYIWINEKIDPP